VYINQKIKVTAILLIEIKSFGLLVLRVLGGKKQRAEKKKGTKEKGFLLESVVFADKRKFSGGCFFGSQKNG
jgi:hypothetical protein